MGLLLGAGIVRRQTRRQLQAPSGAAAAGTDSPETLLGKIRQTLGSLLERSTLERGTPQLLDAILKQVGHVQLYEVPAFVAARPQLQARLGLARYAQLMDRFAAGERQFNRAWSAAADGAEAEALDCLKRAQLLLEETTTRLS